MTVSKKFPEHSVSSIGQRSTSPHPQTHAIELAIIAMSVSWEFSNKNRFENMIAINKH